MFMEMDAAAAFALSVAIDRAVPCALAPALENERLKTALQKSAQEHEAFRIAECEKVERRNKQIDQAVDRLSEGVPSLQVLVRVLYIIAVS
jgi:hypothetical protein